MHMKRDNIKTTNPFAIGLKKKKTTFTSYLRLFQFNKLFTQPVECITFSLRDTPASKRLTNMSHLVGHNLERRFDTAKYYVVHALVARNKLSSLIREAISTKNPLVDQCRRFWNGVGAPSSGKVYWDLIVGHQATVFVCMSIGSEVLSWVGTCLPMPCLYSL